MQAMQRMQNMQKMQKMQKILIMYRKLIKKQRNRKFEINKRL